MILILRVCFWEGFMLFLRDFELVFMIVEFCKVVNLIFGCFLDFVLFICFISIVVKMLNY